MQCVEAISGALPTHDITVGFTLSSIFKISYGFKFSALIFSPGILVTYSGVGNLMNEGILLKRSCYTSVSTETNPTMYLNPKF